MYNNWEPPAPALAVVPSVVVAAGTAEPAGKMTLAVVGCAHSHAPGYIHMLKAHKDVQIKYVWDTDAQRAKKWADELGGTAVPDPAAVWADLQVKGAVICSQTNLHQRLVLAGAKAGKHLFVEKPLGVSAVECRRDGRGHPSRPVFCLPPATGCGPPRNTCSSSSRSLRAR